MWPYKQPTAEKIAADELHAAKLDLLEAEAAVEAWVARRDMLLQRIERLTPKETTK